MSKRYIDDDVFTPQKKQNNNIKNNENTSGSFDLRSSDLTVSESLDKFTRQYSDVDKKLQQVSQQLLMVQGLLQDVIRRGDRTNFRVRNIEETILPSIANNLIYKPADIPEECETPKPQPCNTQPCTEEKESNDCISRSSPSSECAAKMGRDIYSLGSCSVNNDSFETLLQNAIYAVLKNINAEYGLPKGFSMNLQYRFPLKKKYIKRK